MSASSIRRITHTCQRTSAGKLSSLLLEREFYYKQRITNDYDACWEIEDINQSIDPVLLNPFEQLQKIKIKYKGDVFPRIPELLQGLDHLEIFQRDIDANVKDIIAINLK